MKIIVLVVYLLFLDCVQVFMVNTAVAVFKYQEPHNKFNTVIKIFPGKSIKKLMRPFERVLYRFRSLSNSLVIVKCCSRISVEGPLSHGPE